MAITIATFERGGTFHIQGTALAALAARLGTLDAFGEVHVTETPTASIGNAERLETGEADFGFVAANLIGRAARGEAPFEHPIDLRIVAPANVGPVFFVAAARSGLRVIDDLRGKRIAVGPRANAMRNNVAAIFRALGWADDNYEPLTLDFREGARALIEGRADAQVHPPIPNQVVTELAQALDINVVEYGPGQLDRVLRALPLFRRAVMPKGSLRGVECDSEQLGVFNLIATHAREPDDKVGAFAELMALHAHDLGRLTPLFVGLAGLFAPLRRDGGLAFKIDGVGLHPAALAAYRRLGLVSPEIR
jgi:TRAP transporter TAXI family solute receptor